MRRLIVLLLCVAFSQGLSAQTPFNGLYVVNNLEETLSLINLTTGEVVNNVTVLGNVPNDIRIDGMTAYVVNSISADISVIDLLTGDISREIGLTPQGNPWAMLLNGSTAYVTETRKDRLLTVDLASGAVIDSIAVGVSPQGISASGDYIFIANTGFDYATYAYAQGTATVYDTRGDSVIATIDVPLNPQGFTVGPDGTVFTLCTGDYFSEFGKIAAVDPSTLTVVHTADIGGSPGALDMTDDGIIYIAAGGGWNPGDPGWVYRYDAGSDSLLNSPANPILTAGSAMGITIDETTGIVYVSCFGSDQVQAIHPADGSVLATYDVGDGPSALALGTGVLTPVEPADGGIVADRFALEQNYPNPFNPETTIRYTLDRPGDVRLAVYSVTGREVAVIDDGFRPAGTYSAVFSGAGLASGMYLYRLTSPSGTLSGKMMLLK